MNEQFFMIVGVVSVLSLVAEYAAARWLGKTWYNFTDLMANLNIGVGQVFVGLLATPVIFFLYDGIERHAAIFHLDAAFGGKNAGYWLVSLLLVEFCQYWGHRLSHKNNFFVAGHITHHTSNYFNISTALRINWFYRLFAWMFFIPVAFAGVSAQDFFLLQVVMNGYNLLMHTRFDVPYGIFRGFLVTPMHHRIHHSGNPEYVGRNYGAMLIVFDRMFGTHAEGVAGVECAFGSGHDTRSTDPFTMNFHYLRDCLTSARARGVSRWRFVLSSSRRPDNPEAGDSAYPNVFSVVRLACWGALLAASLYFTSIKDRLGVGDKVAIVTGAILLIWLSDVLARRGGGTPIRLLDAPSNFAAFCTKLCSRPSKAGKH